MKKYESIPKRLEEEYHTIKDDTPLVNVYTTREMTVCGMQILNDLLTNAIRDTQAYKDYVEKYEGVEVPMIQLEPAESTQGTYRTHTATRTPNPDVNVAAVEKKILEEEVEKLVEGEDESDGDKVADMELTVSETLMPDAPSQDPAKPTSSRHKNLPGIGQMEEMCEALREKVPQQTLYTTNYLMKETLPRLIIEELFKIYMQNMVLNVHPTTSTSTATTSDLQQQLYLKMKSDFQSKVVDRELWNALKAKYEKSSVSTDSCRQKKSRSSKSARGSLSKQPAKETNTSASKEPQQQDLDAWVDILVIDEDEVILEDGTLELIHDLLNVDKQVHTIYSHERMKAPIKDMLSNQFRDVEEYAYHLEAKKFIENQNENTEEKKYVLSLHKIHATSFPKEDLEEKMIQWVRRVFNTFNEEARIVEVVKVTTEQQYGFDFIERIIMMRENDKLDSFSEDDFKYLNKNDIKDISCVIWEIFHDFQLGIESYQIKINLTALILTFLGIEACNTYSIIDKPTVGLIYLNNKEEKKIMDVVDISKFCDATLEKVLKEVKLKIFETEFNIKTSLLGKLNFKIMKA
ncbi:hypothetical protein Tco_0281688 [Tanacetum coccineum]